jgi:hypothetical protein
MALTIPSNETSDGIKVVSYEMGTKLGNYVALIDTSGNVISTLPVTVNGSFASIKSSPVVGAKTVTTTAAAIFAGSTVLANRYLMIVYSDPVHTIYWGPPGVTVATGMPILPGDSVTFEFSPSVATPIYMIASASSTIRVVELA